jgi:hypothetical protein
MPMRTFIPAALVVASVAIVLPAFADDKANTHPEAPKPAPALVDSFKGTTGTWACKGKFQKMDGSGEMTNQSTMVLRSELDGFAYSGTYTLAKNAMMPNGMKGQMFWAYDAANNKLVEFFADSFGGTGRGTSDGIKGNIVVWDEDGVMMGKANKTRTTVTLVGPKELALNFDMQTPDGKWSPMGSNSCKKR